MKRNMSDMSIRTARTTVMLCAAVLLFGAAAFSLTAQETYWEGSVGVSAYGRLPNTGMYAASDAFPLDTKVTVRNEENGRTVEVRVVERLDDSRVFILVSPSAAEELGIASDEVAQAKVRPAEPSRPSVADGVVQERAYTLDSDLNPSAEVAEASPEEAPRQRPADAEEPAGAEPRETTEQETEISEALQEQEAPAPSQTPEAQAEGPNAVAPTVKERPPSEEAVREPDVEEPTVDKVADVFPEESDALADVEAQEPEADREAGETQESEQEQPETAAPSAEPSVAGLAIFRPEPAQKPVEPEMSVPQVRTAEPSEPSEEPRREEESETAARPTVAEGPIPASPEPLFPRRTTKSWAPAPPKEPTEATTDRAAPVLSLQHVLPAKEERLTLEETLPYAPQGRSSLPKVEGPLAEEAEIRTVAEPGLPEEKREEREPTEKPAEQEPIPEGAELTLRPAEERPPEQPTAEPQSPKEEKQREKASPSEEEGKSDTAEKPEVEKAKQAEEPEETRPAGLESLLTERLKESGYYLQVGAYREAQNAGKLAQRLAADYPVAVYTGEESGDYPYKVMVGPLNEDESGAVLFSFRNRGYRDAFLRKGR